MGLDDFADSKRHYKNPEKDMKLVKSSIFDGETVQLDDYFDKTVKSESVLTTETGCPISNNQYSLTAGERGPILLQDYQLLEKLQHFTREKIVARQVHPRGSGCYGYFELTEDISKYCKAKIFKQVGEKIPLFCRLSLVVAEQYEPETTRDLRGFAVKMYTEEGNWDLLCTNIPVFPVRDPMKMSDMVHAMRRNPQTNLYDPDAYWDFFSQSPESLHCLMMLHSDKGIPDGYRHMHAYGNHTFRFVNDKDEVFFVKFHLLSDQGLKGLTIEEAKKLAGDDTDYYTRDLYTNISKGNFPSWSFCLQIMPENEATNYRYDIFDVTKVWPHSDYPLLKIGKIVLNKLPNNFHMESEQSAFNPASLIPGIEATPDRLLQGRLFAYRDAQLYRLGGPNYVFLPVNCPFKAKVDNHQINGLYTMATGGTSFPNYEPNSFGGGKEDPTYKLKSYDIKGEIGRFSYTHPNSDFEQVNMYITKAITDKERENLIKNICAWLGQAKKEIQLRQCLLFNKVNKDFGNIIATKLGLTGGS